MNSKYDKNLIAYALKNSYTPYNCISTPINLIPVIIKTNPHARAMDPFIFLAKNIIVSDNPTNIYSPTIKRIFDSISKALSKKNKIPIPYKIPAIPRITVPSSIYIHMRYYQSVLFLTFIIIHWKHEHFTLL